METKTRFGILVLVTVVMLFVGAITIGNAANTGVLVPIANGTYQQWLPSDTRYSHYTQVDEVPCNGSTDFVYTLSTSTRETYSIDLSSVPNGATITDITITPCAGYIARGRNTSLPIMQVSYIWNTTLQDGGNYVLNSVTPIPLSPTTFSGLSLTKDTTSRLQIGARYVNNVIQTGISGIRLSNINTVLKYSTSTATTTPINPPSNLVATSTPATPTSIRLNWQDNSSNETDFFIKRGPSPSSLSYLTSVPANTTTYIDYAVTVGATYFYCVYAHNSTSDSACSNTAAAVAR